MDFGERLRLFNDKSRRLQESRFLSAVKGGLAAEVKWTAGEDWFSKFKGPDREAIDAAAVTLRQFIQDNDACSIRNLWNACNAATGVRPEHVAEVTRIREDLNRYLETDSPFAVGDTENPPVLTKRELLETYIYGDIAHTGQLHRRNFKSLSGSQLSDALALMEFVAVATTIVRAVKLLAEVNDRVLAEMSDAAPAARSDTPKRWNR